MMVASRQYTVRVNEATHRALRELTARSGESTAALLERVVARYQREQLLAEANAAWAEIRADSAASAEIATEQALWEQTLDDRLEREEW
jgi:hypothetical protein